MDCWGRVLRVHRRVARCHAPFEVSRRTVAQIHLLLWRTERSELILRDLRLVRPETEDRRPSYPPDPKPRDHFQQSLAR